MYHFILNVTFQEGAFLW